MLKPIAEYTSAVSLVLLTVALTSCRRAHAPRLFELLPPEQTGVTFVNRLPEDTGFNILKYLYYYDGGGVAVGDINNDGLPDLYFTSNLGPNRLYLNKGNYQFEDITQRAGVADAEGWKTGVTMADVNGDGYIDIYVCAVDYLTMHGHNVLYINNGDGTFTDRTEQYGRCTRSAPGARTHNAGRATRAPATASSETTAAISSTSATRPASTAASKGTAWAWS